jgi:hypothetical protein
MQDSEGLANGHMEPDASGTTTQSPPPASVAVEVAAVDEDAMDTAPDSSQGLVQPIGSADQPEAPPITPSSPAQNGVSPERPPSNDERPAPFADNEEVCGRQDHIDGPR